MKADANRKTPLQRAAFALVNTVTVLLAAAALSVSLCIVASQNRTGYPGPVFGDTLLVHARTRGGDAPEDIPGGALAFVDLGGGKKGNGYYGAFLGDRVAITRDPVGNIGEVYFYIPVLGGILEFFRNFNHFFFLLLVPLLGLLGFHALRVISAAKAGPQNKKTRNTKPRETEEHL